MTEVLGIFLLSPSPEALFPPAPSLSVCPSSPVQAE